MQEGTLGGRLKEVRIAAGFESQGDLARATGIPRPTITRIENDQRSKRPSGDMLQKLADATGATTKWLQSGEGQKWQKGKPPKRDAIPLRDEALREFSAAIEKAIEEVRATPYSQGERYPKEYWLREAQLAYERAVMGISVNPLAGPGVMVHRGSGPEGPPISAKRKRKRT